MPKPCFRARGAAVARLALLLAFAASAVPAASIAVEPIMVGTGASRFETDFLFAGAIFEQVPLGVVASPERLITDYAGTSLSLGANMSAAPATFNLSLFLADASWQRPPEITVWYVDRIYVSGGEARGITFVDIINAELRFGVGISLSVAKNDTLAHELAHVLTWYIYESALYFTCADPTIVLGGIPSGCLAGDPAHSSNPNNLLASGSIRNYATSIDQIYGQGGDRDRITASQAWFMLLHTDFFVPEPSGALLIGSGTALVWLLRRRRAA